MIYTNRRSFLKGALGAGLTLTAVGTVSAGGERRYIVAGGDARRIERAGFTVEHALADEQVFVVTGTGSADDLRNVRGVVGVTPDVRLRLDGQLEPGDFVEGHPSRDYHTHDLWGTQWDREVTDTFLAHETTTGEGSTLAVIDTGVDMDHAALPNVDTEESRLFRMSEVYSGEGEVVTSDGTTTTKHVADDVYGHGTHVSGIAAGNPADDEHPITGVAPGAEVLSYRVFYYVGVDEDGDGDFEDAYLSTTIADILIAIAHAAAAGVDAMNMSIGTPPLPPQYNRYGFRVAFRRVINWANQQGSVVVVSAGNSDADLQHGGFFTVPNSVNGTMSISATGPNDLRVFYSNYGTNEISVGAPGGGYETLLKTIAADWDDDGDGEYRHWHDTDGDGDIDDGEIHLHDHPLPEYPYPFNLVYSSVPSEFYDREYAYFAGTSMAAPQVTGTAALVRAVAPRATVHQVERAIESGATGAAGDSSADVGAGILNVKNAVDGV